MEKDGTIYQEDLMVVHCFCVCSYSALLGDLCGVSRSVECEFLSVLNYPKFFLSVFITKSSSNRDILLCYSFV